MKKLKAARVLVAKLMVSGGLLAYFLTRIDLERFLGTLAAADFSYIVLALGVYLTTQTISAARWAVLARPLGFEIRFRNFLVYYLIGMFFNLFAPGTVGGDVSRVYYLARDGRQSRAGGGAGSTLHSVVSVLMDRAVGMVVLLWLGALGLALFPQFAVPAAIRSLTFALAGAGAVAAVLVPFVRLVLPPNGHALVKKLRIALGGYRDRVRSIPQAVLLSFVAHVMQAWMHVVMGWALHVEIPFAYAIILYPLVGAFSAIPVSLNGIGLREGGYIFMLGVIGFGSETGIAFGLLLLLIVAVDSLIGGVVFLLRRGPAPAVMAAEAEIRSDSV
ncbi:MAG TPA: lysylphosphatidylglycerol synthase transmembrane domain-containing protein [candidate division Zixibacteria bacterium]|nr:lysylphosphatidylglycerol synthase transmembrane domain-containing protein [candidate division Zixibacteria bacterium]